MPCQAFHLCFILVVIFAKDKEFVLCDERARSQKYRKIAPVATASPDLEKQGFSRSFC